MKKHTLVLFSLFVAISVSAQEVVATQGDSYSNASANIDFTIGEVIIDTGTDGTNDLTQGFHLLEQEQHPTISPRLIGQMTLTLFVLQ